MAIIFISHKLNEVLDIADRVTVLRRGKMIETVPTEGATREGLARLMVGREVLLRVDKTPAQPKEPLLDGREPDRARRPRAPGRAATSRSRFAQARSSASPASTATARPS